MPSGSASGGSINRLVGRDAELDELRIGLADAAGGSGGLFLLTGPAGIGKSRLVEALSEAPTQGDLKVRWGRCWEGGGAAAYWPWVQVVRACLADTPTEILAGQLGPAAPDVAQLAPELYRRLPGLAPPPPTDGRDERARFFDGVVGYLLSSVGDATLLVALEDLHAADEPSLRLLLRFVSALEHRRALVVGTFRDDELAVSPRRRQLLAEVAAHGRRLHLEGISEAGVGELLQRAVGPLVPQMMRQQVHALTNGNPFLTLEVARQLAAGASAGEQALPAEVQALVRSRLQHLDDDDRRLLAPAAVLGREFDLGPLARLTGSPADGLVDMLERAARHGIVREVGLGRWSFAHALLRERLYEDLGPPARADLHHRAGRAIEAWHDPEAAPMAELAHHFFEGAPVDGGGKAVRYCTLAGEGAMASLAFEEAVLHYERAIAALDLAAAGDLRRRHALWSALGEARYRTGDFPKAREAYGEALRAARALAEPDLVAQAALGYAGMYESAQSAEELGIRVLEEALALLPEADTPLRARVLVALAGRRQAEGAPWDVIGAVSRQGLDMARRVADPAALRAVLWEWHRNAFFAPETLDERLEVADELVRLATSARNQEWLIWALEWRSADRFEAGDIAGMIEDLDRAERDAESLRLPFLIWGATYQRVAVALLDGRFAEAERLADAALEVGERTEFLSVEMNHLGQLMAIRRQQGRFDELDELTRRHAGRFRWKHNDSRWAMLALLRADLGQADEARALLEQAAGPALAASRARGLRVLSVLADACWLLDDRDRAAEVHAALLPHAGHHVLDGIAAYSLGASDRNLAQMAALLGRWDEAEAHFAAARRLHERLGARVWAAHTDVDEVKMLLERGRPEDLPRAELLLAGASAAYRSMGVTGHFTRLDELDARLRSAVSGPSPERCTWARDGGHWLVGYGGTSVRLDDSRGMAYLAALLARPHQPLHVTDLLGTDVPEPDLERARQSVTRALRSAIDRVAAAHPVLGDHLRTSVRVGLSSSYGPDPRVRLRWEP